MQLTTPIGCSVNPMSKFDDQCLIGQRQAQEAKEDEAGDETQGPPVTIRATNCDSAIEPTGRLRLRNFPVVVVLEILLLTHVKVASVAGDRQEASCHHLCPFSCFCP